MSMTGRYGGGYIDKDGKWVQTKFCFQSCGSRCDCQDPRTKFQINQKWLDKQIEEGAGDPPSCSHGIMIGCSICAGEVKK